MVKVESVSDIIHRVSPVYKKRAEEKSISLITPIIGQVIDMKNLIDTESWWEKFINVIK